MEFHISRYARERYQFDLSLFSFNGNVIFANFHAARLFSQKINQKRDLVSFPERAVKAGELNGLGLMDEIFHLIVSLYRKQKNPQVMQEALNWLQFNLEDGTLDRCLEQFVSEFPPLSVHRGEQTTTEYLKNNVDGTSNRLIVLEELLVLWVANQNPALGNYRELFDDSNLQNKTAYLTLIRELRSFFDTQPRFGPDKQNLVDMLRAPAIAAPHSIFAQLEFIRERWSELLGQYLYRLLSSLDLIKEEQKLSFLGPGPVPIPVYSAHVGDLELEQFSRDAEWMPQLVLIAKNTYVWLDQLSRKYNQPLHHLDQIPDEELDMLASWGFTGLWLIGLWERSAASARIKQLCGNPEAIASAYSLAGYSIAADLGGEDAYRILQERAFRRGIRLASDMVPNHMGIDSAWVIEHPDWFISLDYSPFPNYSFSGPDLSPNPNVGILLEDHYYSRSDAAVVFKRIDHHNGAERFIYHGNDGTSMPWNDTAQLNYLNPQVREAVIQTILEVARKFPIIRFDAAMTLAKRHYQRLWFPEPGSGGDIPSRSDHGLTRQEFDTLMPMEFWREVVDRVAQEAPDTLLLAEAFWLMESYFVRTLGMHRVYNSAFMNLLRNEDNARYRTVMKNTLEFDPEILKRFVNFMNNPDERTAVDQFGKGDKYFGICVMMSTLPGLPMFGHGQIEGYTEKYGMEYRRAYWNEQPDPYLVERHQRELFPILHRRALFAGVENFLLYDFFSPGGGVNEDVFAYSNGLGSERNLVIFHNKYASVNGWIRNSAAFTEKSGDQRRITQRTIGEGLSLHNTPGMFVIYRDTISGLEYISSSREIIEKGMYLELGAYKYHVFMDFHEVKEDDLHAYSRLNETLGGRGVPSIEQALQELLLAPVQQPFAQISNPGYFQFLLASICNKKTDQLPPHLITEANEKMLKLLQGIENLRGLGNQKEEIQEVLRNRLESLLTLPIITSPYTQSSAKAYSQILSAMQKGLVNQQARWLILFGWLFTAQLGSLYNIENYEVQSQSWLDEWQLGRSLTIAWQGMGMDESKAHKMLSTLLMLVSQQNWYKHLGKLPLSQILQAWLTDENVQRFLGINRYQETVWFNKESFDEFCWWMLLLVMLSHGKDLKIPQSDLLENLLGAKEILDTLARAEKTSEYQLAKLMQNAKQMENA